MVSAAVILAEEELLRTVLLFAAPADTRMPDGNSHKYSSFCPSSEGTFFASPARNASKPSSCNALAKASKLFCSFARLQTALPLRLSLGRCGHAQNRGYNLQHNFRHGTNHLAAVLLILNLKAFAPPKAFRRAGLEGALRGTRGGRLDRAPSPLTRRERAVRMTTCLVEAISADLWGQVCSDPFGSTSDSPFPPLRRRTVGNRRAEFSIKVISEAT
jgi:hypothetical protein